MRAAWAGGEGYACVTSRGILGSCQSFRSCYPFFKVPSPVVRYPVLNAWDTWVLGNYDTCSYYINDGREAHGVCCTNPISPSMPTEIEDTEQSNNKVDLPLQNNNNFANFGSWPPPIPTHPPNHAAPTHPPSHFGVTQSPVTAPTTTTTRKTTTTWATKPPLSDFRPPINQPVFAPIPTTSKRPTIIIPTEPSIINEVSFDGGGSCGAKNGFLVRKKNQKVLRNYRKKLILGSRTNRWRTKRRSQ